MVSLFSCNFTIKNDNIALYAKNIGNDRFSINTYINTNTGIQKNTFTASITLEQITTPEPIITEPIEQTYKPDLIMASSHDFKTFWKDTFNIEVKAYDARINPSATGFEGRLDGVDVKVLLSLDGNKIATLSGVTEYGEWFGEYFFKENISAPGEYAVDVILSYLGETVSKSSTFFVIATTLGGDISNHSPIANAGSDVNVDDFIMNPSPPPDNILSTITLVGSGSSDPDGDSITYLWTIIDDAGTGITLDDETLESPSFTAVDVGVSTDLIFGLVVNDSRLNSIQDTVIITLENSGLS